jgi:hypothetical protein
MASAEDFIPKEADIEVNKPVYLDGVVNYADDDDIVEKIRRTVDDYDTRFTSQRQEWASDSTGLWNQMDSAFRSFINNTTVEGQKSIGANEPDDSERARIGTTQFHRQVTQMAANGYAIQTSKDMPFKYEALQDTETIDSDADHAEQRAKKLNLLAKWTMKKDGFDLKSMEFWTQIKKYGNIPVMIEWLHERGTKTIRVPRITAENEIDGFDFEEIETVVENRPQFSLLPIEGVKADTVIGNIQDQECVIVSSVVGLSDIIGGIESGFYREDLIEDIGKQQQWDGYSGFENAEEKKDNRGMANAPTGASTGQYLKREVYVNVPIADGKWDDMKNVPLRYRVTMFGNCASDSVIGRIERNQEPDDTIPIAMIHSKPDDPDLLYHISDYEVVRPNLSVATTLTRQIVDNNSLVTKAITWEVEGEVQGNDREMRAGQRFVLENKDSMGMFNIRDISQSSLGLLEYVKEDSNIAVSLDKNMQGESFGARTSASEAGTISSNTQRPNLVNIEYILTQLLGFVAQRYKINWETYGTREQIIQITDDDDKTVFIRPTDIHGEFDIVIDIMDDIKDDAVVVTRMINYIQTVGSIPQLSQTMDWNGISERLAEKMMGTSKFVVAGNEGDAESNARANIFAMFNENLPIEERYPEVNDAMNLRKHLDMYKKERLRWKGREDQNPQGIEILDQVIAQIDARIATPPAQGQQGQQGGQQAPVGEAEAQRQQLSGALGG